MKLTKEQIQLINQKLISKGVVYEDVKLELIDHIASAVEEQIKKNDCCFEDAFQNVFDKWQLFLQPIKTSVWFFNDFKGPKIVVDKWVLLYKQHIFSMFIYSFIFGLTTTVFFLVNHQEEILITTKYFVRALFVIYITVTIIGLLFIWISKVKTIYGRLFLRGSNQVYGLPLIICLGINPLFNVSGTLAMKLFWNFLLIVLLVQCFFSLTMLFKHFKIVKKYRLI